ncbi:MAG: DUF2628 domain-containing protein [Clostridium argentinense]|uniref:DUF2628 domain-containing protein n=1 Tax=Clostridium faecium TaxID=2762223 RepID=A0ABR8YVI1_9CLOT|nr:MULTISPECIES: DUF2628 domain-containing protein [Clostridium]MBD8048147.1 DUF2628 domain-containing protein [Clostridium faecium]MBS5823826.1 DUF2628 domain-containing protein [Clostridium argentinense]
MECNNCGSEVKNNDGFCNECGAKILTEQDYIEIFKNNEIIDEAYIKKEENIIDYDKVFDNISKEEIATFIGKKNNSYYLDKWVNLKFTNKYASWNWCAFFMSSYWLLYRKMYLWGFVTIVVNFVSIGGIVIGETIIPPLVLSTLLGIFGNSIYYNHAKEKIYKVKEKNLSEEEKLKLIKKRGGINLAIPLLIFILTLLFFYASIVLFISIVSEIAS